MLAVAPLLNRLIIDVTGRLRQEAGEAFGETELMRRVAAVVGSAGAPKEQRRPGGVEAPDLLDNGRHWEALGSDGANQGVVNIHEYNVWFHLRPNALVKPRRRRQLE